MGVPARSNAGGWAGIAIGLAVAVLGCGGSGKGPQRLPVHGTITHRTGDKLSGSISFLPDQKQPGPSAVASVVDGAYRFDKTNGPGAGAYRVVITQAVSKQKIAADAAARKGKAAAAQAFSRPPEKREWTFSVTVPAQGPYQFDFKLEEQRRTP